MRLNRFVLFVAAAAILVPVGEAAAGTDDGLFNQTGAIPAGATVNLTVAGRGGVPDAGVGSVALNVTAVNALGSGYITVWPAGQAQPDASNLNFVGGQTIPNMVIVPLGANGQISFFSSATVDLLVDVLGWFPAGSSFTGLTPARLMDTRGGPKLNGGGMSNLTVAGRGGVPGSGVGSVALNVTAVNPLGSGYITVWPAGQAQPNASNLNFVGGQTIPNMVIVPLGANGQISFFSSATVDLLVDVLGWFPAGSSFTGLTPARLMDTRGREPLNGGGVANLTVAGRGGVPDAGVGSVALNVTAVNPLGSGYITVWPAGQAQPDASNLNFVGGQTIPNMVIVPLGANGQISFFSSATVDLLVDVLGWFPAGSSFTGLTPARLMDTRTPPAPAPPPPPPPTPVLTFTAGTHLVPSSMPPGRYVAAGAVSGCYWERLSGLGGTLGEILANDFQGYNGRAIVDITGTEIAFSFTGKCGAFKTYVPPTSAPATSIVPGAHVVGAHILSGTYVAQAAAGCYWERTRSFDGKLSSIIANDFVGTAGTQYVAISSSDVGFITDADCGTWQRVSA